MPFRLLREDSVLTTDDLDFLQEAYEAAASDVASIDDATMHEIVKAMIEYYRSGVTDKDVLAAIASARMRRAVC